MKFPGRLTLALALAGLAGCQHTGHPTSVTAARPPAPESATRVSAQQAAEVQLAYGRSLEHRGDLAQAREAYLEAQKRDPQRADPYLRLAILYDRQGNFAASAEQYQKALRLAPTDADVYCDFGYSMYLQKRWAEAEQALIQALTLNREHARSHNNLGLVYARTDRPQVAMTEFRLGGCSLSEAHVNLAFALTLDQAWEDAGREYQAALAADPRCEPARIGLRNLQTLAARPRSGADQPGLRLAAAQNDSASPAMLPAPAPAYAPPRDSGVARTFFRVP